MRKERYQKEENNEGRKRTQTTTREHRQGERIMNSN